MSGTDSASMYFAYVSLYQKRELLYGSDPIAVTAKPGTRLGVVPVNFQIGLASLVPGKYRCQVTILGPAGHRSAFWQGFLLLVQ